MKGGGTFNDDTPPKTPIKEYHGKGNKSNGELDEGSGQ
jgi:hypothetical protein